MDLTEKTLASEEKYKGKIIRVTRDKIMLPNGEESYRETGHLGDGVAILPICADGTTRLVRQYRYAYQSVLAEIPAGKLEPGEDPAECAVRELVEEVGLRTSDLTFLGYIYPSPGIINGRLWLYLATENEPCPVDPDEDEFLEIETLPFDELFRRVTSGEIHDAKTVAAVLLAKQAGVK